MNKIKNFLNKNYKSLLFCLIFIFVCIIYNQNIQNLNYILKRGIVLEYSLSKNTSVDSEKIKEKLLKEGLKYSYIKDFKDIDSKIYDSDDKLVENVLNIALPIKADKNKIDTINNISDFIYELYPKSKLIGIKALNDDYHKSYTTFLRFLGIFFVSLFVWVLSLYVFFSEKDFLKKSMEYIKNYINEQREKFINFLRKTKENGFGYFLKKIFFEDTKDENGEDKEPNVTKEIISTIIFVVVCVILIRYFIGELRWIPSGSMRPTILERDRVFVEKLDFPKKEIKRGDILVFYPPEAQLKNDLWSIFTRLSGIMCKDIAFIKRVVGMPNDKFEVKYDENNAQYRVYINDVALDEPYIISRKNWTPCAQNMYCGPFVIPQNHYFMMGDNRGNSQDSRFWGFLEKERIIGRANFMFWPIARINLLKDKYFELHKEKIGNEYKNQIFILNRY